ncbi:MAG: hypothetical protein ACM3KD_11560 [Hyphomicrobiaceae bacterium]
MQMAELALLPKVRETASDTLLVAHGTSCRRRIGIYGLHPACKEKIEFLPFSRLRVSMRLLS